MRTRKTIYILFGILLIVFNIIAYFGYFVTPNKQSIDDEMSGDIYSDIGFIIGFNLFGMIGIILLIMAYTVSKKIKKKELKELQNSINQIGKESGY